MLGSLTPVLRPLKKKLDHGLVSSGNPLLLDELWRRAGRAHERRRASAGCARCAGILKRHARDPPRGRASDHGRPDRVGDRIPAAAKEAAEPGERRRPLPYQASKACSRSPAAGPCARRRAMAAVFSLMMGTARFLIRSKDYRSTKDSAVSVTVEGSPAPVAQAPQATEAMDPNAAASAHGPCRADSTPVPDDHRRRERGSGRFYGTASARRRRRGRTLGVPAVRRKTGARDKIGLRQDRRSNRERRRAGGAPPPPMPDSMTQQPMARSGKGNASARRRYSLGAAAYQARNYARRRTVRSRSEGRRPQCRALGRGEREGKARAARSRSGVLTRSRRRRAVSSSATRASLRAARCQIAMGPDRREGASPTPVVEHTPAAKRREDEQSQPGARGEAGQRWHRRMRRPLEEGGRPARPARQSRRCTWTGETRRRPRRVGLLICGATRWSRSSREMTPTLAAWATLDAARALHPADHLAALDGAGALARDRSARRRSGARSLERVRPAPDE